MGETKEISFKGDELTVNIVTNPNWDDHYGLPGGK
jgi:hypothetical protein